MDNKKDAGQSKRNYVKQDIYEKKLKEYLEKKKLNEPKK
ncbi:hypothetical protein UFOVP386_14 [uncultured Caudovirales phage]|uniref:Uncharacterized protein n=1 Tax=uncultured Caudovirales phage TaxID=2100421 RepID=A0A6J7X3U5_9CAUD|nr:hypothetical protein UFOVP386_14 [uncultured Caudovirales phage]